MLMMVSVVGVGGRTQDVEVDGMKLNLRFGWADTHLRIQTRGTRVPGNIFLHFSNTIKVLT